MVRTRLRRDEPPPRGTARVLRGLGADLGAADLRAAAMTDRELYGSYGVSVWVADADHSVQGLEQSKLVKFDRYGDHRVGPARPWP
jgi:hypothetical protein